MAWLVGVLLCSLLLTVEVTSHEEHAPSAQDFLKELAHEFCDDGKHLLEVDYAELPKLKCEGTVDWHQKNPATVHEAEEEDIPRRHVCLPTPITYNTSIPTKNSHRPLWPVYGTYSYLPPQRWLHSLEHGGVAVLFHPCSRTEDVTGLVQKVRSCLRRHVITPSTRLSPEYPLAVVAWGHRLLLNRYVEAEVEAFILRHALVGAPEPQVWRHGQFSERLVKKAEMVSDKYDSVLCLPLNAPWWDKIKNDLLTADDFDETKQS